MIKTAPTELRLSSFSPDGEQESERTLRIPAHSRGQQTIDIGDYQIVLHEDGSLTVELATLSPATRISYRRFHQASIVLTAKDGSR